MKNKPMMMFAPNGVGGGAAAMMGELGAEIDETDGADPTGEEPLGDDAAAEPAPEPEPKASTFMMDPQTLATALKAAGVGAQPVPEPKAKAPLTPEERAELQKQLRYWEPTPDWQTKFNNLDTQQAALLELRDGMTQQMVTIMQAFMGEREQALQSQFNPALDFIKRHEHEQSEAAFAKTYPGLAAPALAPIKNAVVQHLVQAGKTFTSKEEMFKAVAEGMKAIAPQLDAASPGSSPGDKTNNAITPAPQRGGGGVGGGSAGGRASGVPRAVSLLPKIGP